jgi:hypothetical protein
VCDERINDGCNLAAPAFDPLSCGDVVFGASFGLAPRDTDWFEVVSETQRELTLTVTAEFPAQILILQGECLGELTTLAATAVEVGQSGSLAACVPAGSAYLFISTGTSARPIRSGIPCEGDPDELPGFYGNHYVLELQCAACVQPVFGDLNGDGLVDGADLGLLLGNWDGQGVGDLDGDGIVSGADLGLLLAGWTN